MRIDLPPCNLKTCRFSSDCNCLDKNEFERCDYTRLKRLLNETVGLLRELADDIETSS